MVKELVISPVEKAYIGKIEKELREDEALEQEIQSVEEQLGEEKARRLREYESQKSGVSWRGRVAKSSLL